MSHATTITLPARCPVWCSEDHTSGTPEQQLGNAGWHSTATAHSVPMQEAGNSEPDTCSVTAVVDADGQHVWAAVGIHDFALSADAAEALGRGLLEAAALLRRG